MKHANSDTLAQLAPLLDQVRQRLPRLKEKGIGRFYAKSAALLHFHDDPMGLFADLKVGGDWQRYPVNSDADHAVLLQALDQRLSDSSGTK